MRDSIIRSVHTTPDAGLAAILDHARAHPGDDLILALAIGPRETRVLGVRPAPGAWAEEVERWAQLVRSAPWACMTLIAVYREDDGVAVVVERNGEVTRYRATFDSGTGLGPWQVEAGHELDLAPTLTW